MTVGGTQMPPRVSTGDRDAVLRQIRWCAAVQTPVNCHCQLEENPVGTVEPIKLNLFDGVSPAGSLRIAVYLCSPVAFSALTLLVGRQEGHPACKKLSGGVLAWLSAWSEVQTCMWPS